MNLTVSVFIPTIPKHFQYLDNIIYKYNNMSKEKPDEIVVGVASNWGSNEIKNPDLSKYDNVKIIPCKTNLEVGSNRQQAKDYTNSDIIVYQDSDDFPHSERIHWIKKIFSENTDIWVINHSYVFMGQNIPEKLEMNCEIIKSDELKKLYFPNNKYPEDAKGLGCYGKHMKFPVHAGAVCIKREVLNFISWKKMSEYKIFNPLPSGNYKGAYAEDVEFCLDCLWELEKNAIINLPLLYYRK